MIFCLTTCGTCQSGDGEILESCPTFAGDLETLEPELEAFLEDMTTGGVLTLVYHNVGMSVTVTRVSLSASMAYACTHVSM